MIWYDENGSEIWRAGKIGLSNRCSKGANIFLIIIVLENIYISFIV